jgi:hypothetical protein
MEKRDPDVPQEMSWQETKQRAQGAFNALTGNVVAMERDRAQIALNAQFWANEAWQEHLEDVDRDERAHQPGRKEPEPPEPG